MGEENVQLAKRGYELFGKGDLDSMKSEILSPDVIWRTEGVGPFESEYKGIDALIGYFSRLFELSGGTFKAEVLHIYADDDRAVAIQHVSGSRVGKLLDTRMVVVFEIRDGKISEVTQFAAEPSKLESFWS